MNGADRVARQQGKTIMRKRLTTGLLLASLLALSACASTLDGMWESEARKNCQQEQGPTRQSDCNDRVDDQTRAQSRN